LLYSFQFLEIWVYLPRLRFEHPYLRSIDTHHFFSRSTQSHIALLLIIVVILYSHFWRSIDKILLDEGLRKYVNFRFDVGLMIGLNLKIHVSIGKYLVDGWPILFEIIKHWLDKVRYLFRKYHFERGMTLLITLVVIFSFYVFEDLFLMLSAEG